MDTEPPLATNAVTLAAIPNAVGLSRALVRSSLIKWGHRELVEDAELIVSELATNAVQASGTGLALIRTAIKLSTKTVRIVVFDNSDEAPQIKQPDEVSEGGRGLLLVEVLSSEWGWSSLGRLGGKVVWAELVVPPTSVTDAGLPIRIPEMVERGPNAPVINRNPVVLRRVRDGLTRL